MNINEIIKHSKLSKKDFAMYYHIPYRTILSWTIAPYKPNYRECPIYLLELLERAVLKDF